MTEALATPTGMEQEHRFVLLRSVAEDFLARVAPHLVLDVYDPLRRVSFNRTTYLDTDDLMYLRSVGDAVSRRLRVREYAAAASAGEAPVLTGICFLELKQSSGARRSKVRLRCPPEHLADLGSPGGRFDPAIIARLSRVPGFEEVVTLLAEGRLAPRVTTWYRRASLSSPRGDGGLVRVTLDEGISYCRPVRAGAAGEPAAPVEVIDYGPGRVVEVKHSGPAPAWLAAAMDGLRETEGFSKFRLAMLAAGRASGVRKHDTLPIVIESPVRMRKAPS